VFNTPLSEAAHTVGRAGSPTASGIQAATADIMQEQRGDDLLMKDIRVAGP